MAQHTKNLSIPDRYKAGLAAITQLTDAAYEELTSALREVKPTAHRAALSADIEARIQGSVPRPHEVALALQSLYRARAADDTDVGNFADRLTEALRSLEDEKLTPTGNDWATLKTRLKTLLSFDQTLGLAAKAYDVITEHEHVYCNERTRVLTDLRPVYSGDLTGLPAGAVIVHLLKIAFHESTGVKELFVALDTSDLNELKELLTRAEHKAESLRTLLKAAQVPYLEPNGEE